MSLRQLRSRFLRQYRAQLSCFHPHSTDLANAQASNYALRLNLHDEYPPRGVLPLS